MKTSSPHIYNGWTKILKVLIIVVIIKNRKNI